MGFFVGALIVGVAVWAMNELNIRNRDPNAIADGSKWVMIAITAFIGGGWTLFWWG